MVVITNVLDFQKAARKDQPMPSSKRELTILWGELPKEATFPLDLAKLIGRFNGKLEDLHIQFGGCYEFDPVPFTEAISDCQNLQYLYLSFHEVPHLFMANLESLGKACSTLTKLEQVTLHGGEFYERHGGEFYERTGEPWYSILTPLLHNPEHALKKIAVEGFALDPFEDDEEEEEEEGTASLSEKQFLEACATSTTLRELSWDFSYNSTKSELTLLGQMIQRNSSLEYLTVHYSGRGILTLAVAIKHNKTLKRLELPYAIVSEPRTPNSISKGVAAAFYASLQENDVLERLDIQKWNWENADRWLQYKRYSKYQYHLAGIAFLLAANRAGRAKLLRPDAKPKINDWLDAIANEGNLSVTYFFLRNNPGLCNAAPTKKGKDILGAAIAKTQQTAGRARKRQKRSNKQVRVDNPAPSAPFLPIMD